MSMTTKVCLLGVLTALSGCKAEDKVEGLSAQECRVIRERELEFMNALLKPDSANSTGTSDKAFEKCISGELYSRQDYKCIVAAESNLAMSRCMAQAHEKKHLISE